jgi:hypothetical protein
MRLFNLVLERSVSWATRSTYSFKYVNPGLTRPTSTKVLLTFQLWITKVQASC